MKAWGKFSEVYKKKRRLPAHDVAEQKERRSTGRGKEKPH